MDPINEEGKGGEEVVEFITPLTFQLNKRLTLDSPEVLHIFACVHWAKKSNGESWKESEIRKLIGHAMLELTDDQYKDFDLSNLFKTFRDDNHEFTKTVRSRAEAIKDLLSKKQIPKLEQKLLADPPKRESLIREKSRSETPRYPSIDEVLAGSSKGDQGRQGQGKKLADPRKRESLIREKSLSETPRYPSIGEVLAGSSKGDQGRRGQGK